MNIHTIKKDSRGVVLLELFISISIMVILMTGSLSILFPALKSAEIGRQRLQAKWYAWDEEEAVRQVRSEAWANLTPGTYYPVYNAVANPPTTYQGWELNTGSGIINGFTESITISVPYRVSATQLSNTTGTLDNNMRMIVCSVSWTSFGRTYSQNLTEYLSNWKPF